MASGILYPILRPFAKVGVALYFRKLHMAHLERIPSKGPLIVACNHPNSFAEPIIFATWQKRVLHFIVRGDVFKQPIIAWILHQTNQIPIYRKRDGYSGLRKNDATFEACFEKLRQEEAIMIFSEGLCIFEKRLRDLQKGTARMALGALEKHELPSDFSILPCGVTFTHGDQFRSEVMFNVGEPILVQQYLSSYKLDPVGTTNRLTLDIAESIRPLMIHIESKDRDGLYNLLMDIMEVEFPAISWPPVIYNDKRFLREKQLEEAVNTLSVEYAAKKGRLQKEVCALLAELGLSQQRLRFLQPPTWRTFLILTLSFLPGILGLCIFLIPYLTGVFISNYFKKSIEFYTPVRMVSQMLVGLFQNALLFLVAIYKGWFVLATFILFSPLFALSYLLASEQVLHLWSFNKLRYQGKRNQLVELLNKLIEDIEPLKNIKIN